MSRTPHDLHALRVQWAKEWVKDYYQEHKHERPDRQWPSAAQINQAIRSKFHKAMRPALVYQIREQAGGPRIERGARRGKPSKTGAPKRLKDVAVFYGESATAYHSTAPVGNAMLQVKSGEEATAIRNAIEATNAAGLTDLAVDIDQGKLGIYVVIKQR